MEKLIKYNINFIVAAISSLTIISMCAYMILNVNIYIMNILICIEFLCSFYFVCVFFYNVKKYSRIELFFYLVIYLMPFLLSILGLFYAFNFFSLDRIFLRESIIASFLTRIYHVIFIFYISHIIYFFYLFSVENNNTFFSSLSSNFVVCVSIVVALIFMILFENNNTFFSSLSSNFVVCVSIVVALIFMILYSIFNWAFDGRISSSYSDVKDNIIYEAQTTFSLESDNIDYEGFANSYDAALIYYDNELKYQEDDWDTFKKKHLLFETAIYQGEGFFILSSGKKFTYTYYIFILAYVIVNSLILVFSIFFFKIFLEKKFNSYINIMIKGFKEDSYIYAIETDKMDNTEIKELSELYNKKLLSYKYRERYVKMFTR